jgi:hypothetical protein
MSGRETSEGTTGGETGQEDRERADKATQDNDLTTGHSDPDDGGDDNAKAQKQK